MKMLEDSVIRIMVYNGEDLFGCISFDKETDFSECHVQELSQWITLFDEAEDDCYDGVLGEDDEEGPRVMVSFKIVGAVNTSILIEDSVTQVLDSVNESKVRTFRDSDDEVQIQSVVPVPTKQQVPLSVSKQRSSLSKLDETNLTSRVEEQNQILSTLFGG